MNRIALHDLLADAAARTPAAPALTYRDRTASYAEIWAEVRSAAAQLDGLGLPRGSRVAVALEKRIETVVAIFATSLAGHVSVPVNHVLKPGQVGHILADSGAAVLVTSPERAVQLADALPSTAVARLLLVGDAAAVAELPYRPAPLEVGGDPADVVPRIVDADPAAILYTSGSTGLPKGVVLSHRNLVAGAESVSGYLGNTADDIILSLLPLSFDAGLSQVTTAFAVGAHCVLVNYLLPREVPRLCERHGVTGITGVPPLWLQLLDAEWPDAAASRLRYWANTGGRMPRVALARLRERFPNADPYLMYGLTEAFRSTYLEPSEVDRRPDSIGRAIPNAEVLVLRPDGERCEPGEPGELVHRGPTVALGYWNDPERTRERFRALPGPDWRAPETAVWSGDTVVADADGYLYFVGRADDMIKTSGYRVSPTELEEAASATGLIRDAVAIGLPDAVLGQRILLAVSPGAPGFEPRMLLAELRRSLPAYMVPSEVVVHDELPRSPNGKFDRTLLRSESSA